MSGPDLPDITYRRRKIVLRWPDGSRLKAELKSDDQFWQVRPYFEHLGGPDRSGPTSPTTWTVIPSTDTRQCG